MDNILKNIGIYIEYLSNTIWAIAMPLIVIITILISLRMIFKIKNKTTSYHRINILRITKNSIVTMGTIIGTGALVGVLGSLSNMYKEGQCYIEGICIWALIGLMFLSPFAYSETLMARIVKLATSDYIKKFLGNGTSNLFKVVFIIIFVFGFGGFQFSAINAATNIVSINIGKGQISTFESFFMVVVPLMVILSIIVLLKKQGLIIKSLATLTTISVSLYIIFFFVFFFKTSSYWPIFFYRMTDSIRNPVSMMLGIPLGLMIGLQKIMQTADVGIGVYGMVSKENKVHEREAALASAIVIGLLFIVGILATTYITSYGVEHSIINLSGDSSVVLSDFYKTSINVTGNFGLIAVAAFSILTGFCALLGRYYYLNIMLKCSENKKIITYIILLSITGTFAVFGFSIIFNLVNLLIFIAFAINIAALYVFTKSGWKEYQIKEEVLK